MAGRINLSDARFVRDLNGVVRDHQKKIKRRLLLPAGVKAAIKGSSGESYRSTPDTSEPPL